MSLKMYNIEVLKDEVIKKMETPLMINFAKISLKDDPTKYCILPKKFAERDLERIKNMEIFEDDIWIVAYPKCGSTWTQELVWMIGHNLDYENALKIPHDDRFSILEFSAIATNYPKDTFEKCQKSSRPRYIRSHLPIFLLPDQLWTVKPKIIYTAQNPRDTAISWYNLNANLHGFEGTMHDFFEAFVKDLVPYSPMNDHVVDFWNIRNQSNILILFFEDIKKNLNQEVKKIMEFFGRNYSQEEVDKLCHYFENDAFKKIKTINEDDR